MSTINNVKNLRAPNKCPLKQSTDYTPAVIGALGTLGASMINAGSTQGYDAAAYTDMMRKQVNAQKELYDYQYNKQSMKAIIGQYKDAGVSPAALLSDGHISSSVPSSMPSAPNPDPNASLNQKAFYAQLANQAADIALKYAQTQKIKEETKGQELQNTQTDIRNQFLPMYLNNELSLQQLDKYLKRTEAGKNDAERQKIVEETAYIRRQQLIADRELEKLQQHIREATYKADIEEMRKNVTPEFIEKELASLQGDIDQKKALAAQLHSLMMNLNADTDLKQVQKEIQNIALKYADDIELSAYLRAIF